MRITLSSYNNRDEHRVRRAPATIPRYVADASLARNGVVDGLPEEHRAPPRELREPRPLAPRRPQRGRVRYTRGRAAPRLQIEDGPARRHGVLQAGLPGQHRDRV